MTSISAFGGMAVMSSSRLGDTGLEGLDPLPHAAARAIAASTEMILAA